VRFIFLYLIFFAYLVNDFSCIYADNISVCTMAIGEDYQRITYATTENKIRYCEKHNHRFIYLMHSMDTSRPIPWSKILLIKRTMMSKKVDWVFWTDADSLIMNDNIKLEDLIDNRYDMIVASDHSGINTGQFFIRNCRWSRGFLKRVYAMTQHINHGWWEQKAIMDLYEMNESDRKHIKILDQRVMNSYAPEIYPENQAYHEGDFIIHFAGVRGQTLIDLIVKYNEISLREQL